MRVHVKVAKTPMEIDGVFLVRHRVFIEEDGKFPAASDRRLYDFFDTIPTTVNIIAMVDDKVIGCLRMTEESEAGLFQCNEVSFTPGCYLIYAFMEPFNLVMLLVLVTPQTQRARRRRKQSRACKEADYDEDADA